MHPIPKRVAERQSGRVIKHLPLKSIRATAATFAVVAACTVAAVSASAQNLNTNIFGGTGTPNSLTVTSIVGSSSLTNNPFGPGFTGSLTIGTGALTTLSESISNGTYAITEAGVVGVTSTFSATKTFTDNLASGQYYRLTLTTSTASSLNALSGFSIQLSSGGVVALDTATGTGLLGITNVVGLFNGTNTATLVFQAPANFPASGVTATFSGGFPASGLGSSLAFSGASVVAVPEPNTWTMMGTAFMGLLLVCFRRRSA